MKNNREELEDLNNGLNQYLARKAGKTISQEPESREKRNERLKKARKGSLNTVERRAGSPLKVVVTVLAVALTLALIVSIIILFLIY